MILENINKKSNQSRGFFIIKNMNDWVLMLDDQRGFEDGLVKTSVSVKIPAKYDYHEKILVKTYDEFVQIIESRGLPEAVFIDHDLGLLAMQEGVRTKYTSFDYSRLNGEKTGLDVARFLIKYCQKNKLKLPDYYSQSMNPVGRKNILDLLNKYKNQL